jgi:hypothetical protein
MAPIGTRVASGPYVFVGSTNRTGVRRILRIWLPSADKLGMSKSTPTLLTDLTANELRQRIAEHERVIAQWLAPYDPVTATMAWFDTLRAIEECINFIHVDWDDGEEQLIFGLPVLNVMSRPDRLAAVRSLLSARFSEKFANRFIQLVVQGASSAMALDHHGITAVLPGFANIGAMIGYLASRRRHFVAMLHALPLLCRGTQRVTPIEAMNAFLPSIELQGLSLVGAEQALLINAARERLKLDPARRLVLPMLDMMFLEPERSRITEVPMTDEGMAMLALREPLASDRLFSAAELRNDILAMEATYAEFDLAGTEFSTAATFVRRISRDFVDRDFWIAISPRDLARLSDEMGLPVALRNALVHSGASYSECLATYAPFVLVDGLYRSTVTLLSRFMYQWRAVSLDGRKRFQIRAGFIFEQAVARELERQGFAVQSITRVSRHEFDVVTVRDGTIWNVQCKNNFLDLGKLERDPTRFARYNRNLVLSYARALTKESRREQVLKDRLGLEAIEHMVVSRFPVVTDNPRVVPFSMIDHFADIADQLAAR